jgi:hypothetical protein
LSEATLPAASRRSQRLIIAGLVIVSLLIASGQIIAVVQSVQSDHTAVPIPLHGPLRTRISAVLTDALGPSDRGVRRYRVAALTHRNGVRLTVTWAINNDVSGGTVGAGAAADVYDILHDLAAANIPLKGVRLTGTYPVGGHETVVMRLRANERLLHLLRAVGSDGLDPISLWPLVGRQYVNPAVEPSSNE